MSLFVKICGLCSGADVAAVVALKPDAVGFIFWAGSKRHVLAPDVAEWTRSVPKDILKVGVFVDADADTILKTVELAGLNVVQLHGIQAATADRLLENEEGILPVLAEKNVRIWQVLHLSLDDSGSAEGGHVDAYLVDSYSEHSPGGTGKTCDWKSARSFVERAEKPVILAGGLSPANVADAIQQVHPWGVDVSSGVEQRPGQKDLNRVKEFIEICRS